MQHRLGVFVLRIEYGKVIGLAMSAARAGFAAFHSGGCGFTAPT